MIEAIYYEVYENVFQNLFPARGRKHCMYRVWVCRCRCSRRFFRTYSPQGDGNPAGNFFVLTQVLLTCFSEPIPRKGTETSKLCGHRLMIAIIVFQNLFPARGRKPSLLIAQQRWPCMAGFSEPIPRKGTETMSTQVTNPFNLKQVFQNLFPARGRKRPQIL